MSTSVLVIGESGSGKSSSIRNLVPQETFIINVLNKPLPFKGYKSNYKNEKGGNYISTDNPIFICKILDEINENRESINNIIIDDFQYIMANEFLKRATERGFDKFTEIAQKAHGLILKSMSLREDISVFFLSHCCTGDDGITRAKTVGKLLDNQISIEGMFTVVLRATANDGYHFLTQTDGKSIAKSPMGMFDSSLIENDLQYVSEKIQEYYSC